MNPNTPHADKLRLIVAIPALNEQATIGEVLAGIPAVIPGIGQIQTLVVDDGSTDRTGALATAAGAHVIRHPFQRGLGAAFASALTHAIERDADLLVTIDADGQFDPADIEKLTAPIVGGLADFATASRFLDPSLTPQMPWLKRYGNRQMSRLISRLTGRRFHDVSCGMRCYNRRAMLSLNLLGSFTYTQEVFLNLAFQGQRIEEVPVAVGPRLHGESRMARNLWKYALQTSRIIFRAYRDYKPMQLFGRAAAGLMVPAVLLGGFLLAHYASTGKLHPHKWAGFVAGALAGLSILMLHMGILGDMLNRHRVYLEELLYYQRVSGKTPRQKDTQDQSGNAP